MSGFIEGENRYQSTLFPECIDDYVEEESVVRVTDFFIDRLDISGLGFKAEPAETGRPGYHPRILLKIYIYGYLNQVHSSLHPTFNTSVAWPMGTGCYRKIEMGILLSLY